MFKKLQNILLQKYLNLNKELFREVSGQFILKFITGGTSYFLFIYILNNGIKSDMDTWLILQPKLTLFVTLSLFGFDSIYSINFFKNRNTREEIILLILPLIHLIFIIVVFYLFSKDLKLYEILLIYFFTLTSLLNQVIINFIRVRIKIWKVILPNLLASIIVVVWVKSLINPINLIHILSLLILQNLIVLLYITFSYKFSKIIGYFNNLNDLYKHKINIYNYYKSGFLIVSLSAISNLTFYADRYVFNSELKNVIKSNAVILNFLQICGIIVYAFFQGFSPFWTNYYNKLKNSELRYYAFKKYFIIISFVYIILGIFIFLFTFLFTPFLFPNILFTKYEIAIYVLAYIVTLINGSIQFYFNFYFKNHLFLFFSFLNLILYYIIMYVQINLSITEYLVQRSLLFSSLITVVLTIAVTKKMILNERQ